MTIDRETGDVREVETPVEPVTVHLAADGTWHLVGEDGWVTSMTRAGDDWDFEDTGIELSAGGDSLAWSPAGHVGVAHGSNLGVYADSKWTHVSSSDLDLGEVEFKDVVAVGDDGFATTTKHEVLHVGLRYAFRTMSDEEPPAASVEVLGRIHFDGEIGAVAAQGSTVYVTVADGGSTRLVRAQADYWGLEQTGALALDGKASSLAVSEDGAYAFIGDDVAGTVTIVSLYGDYGMEVLDTIRTGPGSVSALAGGRFAVSDPSRGTVTIVQMD